MSGSAAHQRAARHRRIARAWLTFGVAGLIDFIVYLCLHPSKVAASLWPVAGSVPVLFFISVYANYVGHKATAEAATDETGT